MKRIITPSPLFGQLVYTQDLRQAKQSNYFYLGSSLVAIREVPNGQAAVTLYQHTT